MILIKPQNNESLERKCIYLVKGIYNEHFEININGEHKFCVCEGWFLLHMLLMVAPYDIFQCKHTVTVDSNSCIHDCSCNCQNGSPCNRQTEQCDMGCKPGYRNALCNECMKIFVT